MVTTSKRMSQRVGTGGGAQLEGSAAAVGTVVNRRGMRGVGRLGIVEDDRLVVRLGLGLHLLLLLLLDVLLKMSGGDGCLLLVLLLLLLQ